MRRMRTQPALSCRCGPTAQRAWLAASLAVAMAPALGSDITRPDYPAIPLEWPLPYERSARATPLWARLEAMRNAARSVPAGPAPVTRAVNTCSDDDSAGSLRTIIEKASSGDIIDLTSLSCSRISLSQGALKIDQDDLTLIGPGAAALTLDAEGNDRVLLHPGGGTLTIEGLTLSNGRFEAVDTDIGFGGCVASAASLALRDTIIRDCVAVGVGAYGGAVLSGFLTMVNSTISGSTAFGDHPTNGTAAYGGGVFAYGVDIRDSTISGNSAVGTDNAPLSHWEIGGGLFVARNGGSIERSTISDNFAIRFAGGLTQEGDLVLRNSTISGNATEQDDGGGLRVRQGTAVLIENSTIADNHAGSFGGGISFIENALPSVLNSTIVADNSADKGAADIDSAMSLPLSGTNNLILDHGGNLGVPADTLVANPGLRPLANNGGPTRTHSLEPESFAIDRGANPQMLGTDQRGGDFPRVFNGAPDIGAFEYQGSQAEPLAVPAFGRWAAVALATVLALVGWRRRRAIR
jgi:hypothetical protein